MIAYRAAANSTTKCKCSIITNKLRCFFVAQKLNTPPRKLLSYKTSQEKFFELAKQQSVALRV